MQNEPAYADEIRMEPGDYNPKKDIKGKEKDDTAGFEDWVNKTITPVEPVNELEGLTFEDIKPYVSVQKGDDGKTNYVVLDKDEKEIYRTQDSKDAMNYLSKNFSTLRGQAPKVKDFIKQEQEPQELPRQFKNPEKEVMVSKHGKTIVIDKSKEQEYLAKGWALAESINESKTKVDSGFNIAGIEGEDDRVTGEAGLQIARLKYLSNYH